MNEYEVIIIGAGPAGLAAAWGARKKGASRILVLERQETPGGVLNQCIHDGFGVSIYNHSYTGPEYAQKWEENLLGFAEIKTNISVVEVQFSSRPYRVCCVGGSQGYEVYTGQTIVFATGCRERTIGQLRIPGGRPAGIYTAGCAQYMMNVLNLKPGKNAVIFGTGDIGLIMARRLSLEGIQVKMMFGDKAAGLARNYIQCVRDFQIPLKLGYTLVSVHGYKRLKGITIAPVDQEGSPVLSKKEYVPCDTLLTAVGLIPETELFRTSGYSLTCQEGIAVNDSGSTRIKGIYACGNVTKIYDLVDHVTVSGIMTGAAAAAELGYKEETEDFRKIIGILGQGTFAGMEQISDNETICTLCPKGCRIRSFCSEDGIEITGHGCEKGYEYALNELHAPMRTLTTTMRIRGHKNLLLPVHTTKPVARECLREAVKFLNRLEAELPVAKGEILVKDLNGTGAAVAASKSMEKEVCHIR